ncbi:hypothetical protein [Nostocoides sp. F2B08]|uniref:hypothetical protein n=1 Tax=Nostocoides sp. F2B08 TaxID=2653936 RepID=UPI00186AF67C|nr:hypothetical protein [Tetrasphaera sp. F2B08]
MWWYVVIIAAVVIVLTLVIARRGRIEGEVHPDTPEYRALRSRGDSGLGGV